MSCSLLSTHLPENRYCISLVFVFMVLVMRFPADAQQSLESLPVRERVGAIHRDFYALYSADFDRARTLAEWSLKVCLDSVWKKEEADARLDLGVITYLSGNYAEVLPQYLRSLKLYDSLGNSKGCARVNNEMAVFYHKQGDLDRALGCLAESEKRSRATNDLEQLGTSLGHHGAFLAVRGKYEEAYPYYREVLDIRTRLRDSVGLGYVLADLAEYHGHKGEVGKAAQYLQQSTDIRLKLGDVQGVAVNHVNTGEMYFNAGQPEIAVRWLRQGLDEALRIGYKDLARHTYDFLARTYVKLGKYREAYELQGMARSYSDSLMNLDKAKVIEELQARYETEMKDNEIARLNQDNLLHQSAIRQNRLLISALLLALLTIVLTVWVWRSRVRFRHQLTLQDQAARAHEAQLRAVVTTQEQERSRIAADLHDGVGQLVTALHLHLGVADDNATSSRMVTEVHQEIRNVAFNLMPPVLTRDGLAPAITELVRRLSEATGKSFVVHPHGLDKRLPELIEVSLYRVVQELLSNMLRHNQVNHVDIGITAHEDELVVTVEDDGAGFDQVVFRSGSGGNGWRNIQSRLGLIRAQLDIDSVPGRKGNSFIIRVPVNFT